MPRTPYVYSPGVSVQIEYDLLFSVKAIIERASVVPLGLNARKTHAKDADVCSKCDASPPAMVFWKRRAAVGKIQRVLGAMQTLGLMREMMTKMERHPRVEAMVRILYEVVRSIWMVNGGGVVADCDSDIVGG
jgi:hypothetical protein